MQRVGEEDVMQSPHRRSKSVPSMNSGSIQLDDTGLHTARSRSGTDSGQRLVPLNRSKARLSSGGLLRSQSKKRRAKYDIEKSRSIDNDIGDKSSGKHLSESNRSLSIEKRDEEFVIRRRKYGTISVVNNLVDNQNIRMHSEEDFHNDDEREQTAPRDVCTKSDVEDELQSSNAGVLTLVSELEKPIHLDKNFNDKQKLKEQLYKSCKRQEIILNSRRRSLPAKLSKYQKDFNIDYQGHEHESLGNGVTYQHEIRKFHSLPSKLNQVCLLGNTQTKACTGQPSEHQPADNLNQNMKLLFEGNQLAYENEENTFAEMERSQSASSKNIQCNETKTKSMAQKVPSDEKQLKEPALSHRASRFQDDKPANTHRKNNLKRQRRTKSLPNLLVLEEILEEEIIESLENIVRLHVNRAFCELLRKISINQAKKARKKVRRTHSLSTIQERLNEEKKKSEKLETLFHDRVTQDRSTHKLSSQKNTVCKSSKLENDEIHETDGAGDEKQEDYTKEHEDINATTVETHEKTLTQEAFETSREVALHKGFRQELFELEADHSRYDNLVQEPETIQLSAKASETYQQVNEKKKKKKRKKNKKGKDNRTRNLVKPIDDQGQPELSLEHETAQSEPLLENDRESELSRVDDEEMGKQESFLVDEDGKLKLSLQDGQGQLHPSFEEYREGPKTSPLMNDYWGQTVPSFDDHEQPQLSLQDEHEKSKPSLEDVREKSKHWHNQEQPEPFLGDYQERHKLSLEGDQEQSEPSLEGDQEQADPFLEGYHEPEPSLEGDQEQPEISLEGDQEQPESFLDNQEKTLPGDHQEQSDSSLPDGQEKTILSLEDIQEQLETLLEDDKGQPETSSKESQEKCESLPKGKEEHPEQFPQKYQEKTEPSLKDDQEEPEPSTEDNWTQSTPNFKDVHEQHKFSLENDQGQSEFFPEDNKGQPDHSLQDDQERDLSIMDNREQRGPSLENAHGKCEHFLEDNLRKLEPVLGVDNREQLVELSLQGQFGHSNAPEQFEQDRTQSEPSMDGDIEVYKKGASVQKTNDMSLDIPDIVLLEVGVEKDKVEVDTIDEKDESRDFQCNILERVQAIDYKTLDSTIPQRPKILPIMELIPEVSEDSSPFQRTGSSRWEKPQCEEEGTPTRKKSWPLENKASQKRVTWSEDLIEAKSPDAPLSPELEFANVMATGQVIKEEIIGQVKDFDDIISDVINSYLEPDYSKSQSAIHRAVARGCIQALVGLIEEGADVNANDEYGWPPLHVAMLKNNVDCAAILLDAGADIRHYTDTLVEEYQSVRNDTIRTSITS